MFTATKKQQHYLKQLAALQFPGSIDNLSTRLPIYALEQQLPKDDTMKLDDAVIEGQDIEYNKFYDEDGCSYSSVSELVEVQLGLDDDDSIREYNEENPDLPYIPYEKLREMDKNDIPEYRILQCRGRSYEQQLRNYGICVYTAGTQKV